jgi:LuxR family maltose regulon positive regulatory protein
MKLCGGERHVADYLRSEYLSRLRPDTLRFLRRTSVLTRFCGELGDAVLQEEGSGRQLERIERSNLFLVPLDRRGVWYRYHRLFGDLLREELGRREPELVPVLHRRAADWYEAHADPESALEHAYAAADFRRAARLVTTIALPVYYSGRAAVVERWLARFDDPVLLRRHPGVALQGSWVHALRGRAAEARRWLQIAEEGRFRGKLADGSTSLRAWIAVLRAAMCRDGDAHMVADAKAALSALPEGSLLRPSALVVLGAAYTLIGESERADATFAAAAAEAERVGAIDAGIIAISERSLLASARSDLAAADELARAAHDRVGGAHLDGYATSAIAFVASARVSLRHGRWDEARAQLAQAQRLGPPLRSAVFPWLSLQTHLEVGRAHLALRDTHALRSDLAEINDFLRTQPHAGRLVDQVQALAQEAERLCPPGDEETSGLTAAELRLVPLLATHLSFREIGAQLYLSRNTIKTQAISVYRKLGVSSRSEAIDRAVGLGLFAGHGAHTR